MDLFALSGGQRHDLEAGRVREGPLQGKSGDGVGETTAEQGGVEMPEVGH